MRLALLEWQFDNQLDSQLDNQLDSQLDNQLDSQLDNQLDSQLDNQLDSQLDNQLDSQCASSQNQGTHTDIARYPSQLIRRVSSNGRVSRKAYIFLFVFIHNERGDIAVAVADKTDVMYEILYNPKFIPVQSPKVNVKKTVYEGKTSYLMKNHATGTYYFLDELTNLIWNLTDGNRTVSQIVKEVQLQKPKVREKTVFEDLLFFAGSDLLKEGFEEKQKKRFHVVSPFIMDFTLIRNADHFIRSLHSRLRPIFKRWLLWATIVFIIAGAVLFAREFVSIYGTRKDKGFKFEQWKEEDSCAIRSCVSSFHSI